MGGEEWINLNLKIQEGENWKREMGQNFQKERGQGKRGDQDFIQILEGGTYLRGHFVKLPMFMDTRFLNSGYGAF